MILVAWFFTVPAGGGCSLPFCTLTCLRLLELMLQLVHCVYAVLRTKYKVTISPRLSETAAAFDLSVASPAEICRGGT